VIYRHGWTFVDEFVVQHHFARYLSNKYRHPQPVYFYLLVVALLTLPWTALLLEALAGMRSWRWRENEAVCKARVFCLAWLALPILFFSFSGSKLPGYILPVVPAASLLISECVARKHSRWAVRATGLICILLGAAGLTYAARTGSVSLRDAGLTTLPLFIGGISAIVWRRLSEAPYMMVGGAILLTLVVVLNCGAYSMAQRESVRELLKLGATRGYGSTPVFARRGGDRTAEFYASGRVVYDADGEPVTLDDAPQILSEAHKRGEKILVLVPLDSLDVLRQLPEVEVIGDNGEVALIGVRNE
jgi:4-amino-4-deoxy-L-arabinose transferase-like glycosyltransferase